MAYTEYRAFLLPQYINLEKALTNGNWPEIKKLLQGDVINQVIDTRFNITPFVAVVLLQQLNVINQIFNDKSIQLELTQHYQLALQYAFKAYLNAKKNIGEFSVYHTKQVLLTILTRKSENVIWLPASELIVNENNPDEVINLILELQFQARALSDPDQIILGAVKIADTFELNNFINAADFWRSRAAVVAVDNANWIDGEKILYSTKLNRQTVAVIDGMVMSGLASFEQGKSINSNESAFKACMYLGQKCLFQSESLSVKYFKQALAISDKTGISLSARTKSFLITYSSLKSTESCKTFSHRKNRFDYVLKYILSMRTLAEAGSAEAMEILAYKVSNPIGRMIQANFPLKINNVIGNIELIKNEDKHLIRGIDFFLGISVRQDLNAAMRDFKVSLSHLKPDTVNYFAAKLLLLMSHYQTMPSVVDFISALAEIRQYYTDCLPQSFSVEIFCLLTDTAKKPDVKYAEHLKLLELFILFYHDTKMFLKNIDPQDKFGYITTANIETLLTFGLQELNQSGLLKKPVYCDHILHFLSGTLKIQEQQDYFNLLDDLTAFAKNELKNNYFSQKISSLKAISSQPVPAHQTVAVRR